MLIITFVARPSLCTGLPQFYQNQHWSLLSCDRSPNGVRPSPFAASLDLFRFVSTARPNLLFKAGPWLSAFYLYRHTVSKAFKIDFDQISATLIGFGVIVELDRPTFRSRYAYNWQGIDSSKHMKELFPSKSIISWMCQLCRCQSIHSWIFWAYSKLILSRVQNIFKVWRTD